MTTEVTPGATPPTVPTVPAVPAAPAAPAGLEIQPPSTVIVQSTGDPALDIAVSFFSKSGIAQDGEAMRLAQSGDFSLLQAQLAEKNVAGGDAYVAVMKSVHERTTALATAIKAAAENAVKSVVGGDEAWAAVKAFVATKADETELADINAALKAGGVRAKAMAQYLKSAYEAGTGMKLGAGAAPASSAPVAGGHGNAPQGGNLGPLSPRQYSEAVDALVQKVGAGRIDRDPEYAQLRARRLAWKG